MPFLSPGAYILISGIKFEKFVRQIFSFVYPPTSRIQKIGSKWKVNFVRTFFKKTKCTHVNVKNLGGQVSGPKNMATAMVYFSKFPCGSPCSIQLLEIFGVCLHCSILNFDAEQFLENISHCAHKIEKFWGCNFGNTKKINSKNFFLMTQVISFVQLFSI